MEQLTFFRDFRVDHIAKIGQSYEYVYISNILDLVQAKLSQSF